MTNPPVAIYYMGRDVDDLSEGELREALVSALRLLDRQEKQHATEVAVWMDLARWKG